MQIQEMGPTPARDNGTRSASVRRAAFFRAGRYSLSALLIFFLRQAAFWGAFQQLLRRILVFSPLILSPQASRSRNAGVSLRAGLA